MTDETTAPPSGNAAHAEAANELEALRSLLGADRRRFDVLLPKATSDSETSYYRGHVRTLALAENALRDVQSRVNAVRTGLAVQGPTDVPTVQVRNISRLVAELVDSNWPSIDLAVRDIKADSLIAVLRAGLASVVGDATPDSIDEKPAPEPDPAEAPSPSAGPATAGFAAGERLREGLQGVAKLFGVEAPAPEYSSDNPVRQAVYDVLSNGQGDPVPDLVRDVTVAALDSASGVVRSALRHPKVTPLVVLDGADVPAHRLPELADAYRRSTADAAADELRILARSDEVR